jgi:hypothetical protein
MPEQTCGLTSATMSRGVTSGAGVDETRSVERVRIEREKPLAEARGAPWVACLRPAKVQTNEGLGQGGTDAPLQSCYAF